MSTDREMLLLAYGALRGTGECSDVTEIIYGHLFPPIEFKMREPVLTPEELDLDKMQGSTCGPWSPELKKTVIKRDYCKDSV
jgi:hypothetical protein